MKGSVKRVHNALVAAGYSADFLRFAESTRSSEEAAAAVGCAVGQIAKSLVFRTRTDDRPVLVIASGANRVGPERVSDIVGDGIAQADATFVRARTGFAIGGVAPLGHKDAPIVVIDEDLLAFDTIWAAAGAPNVVFRIDPCHLEAMTGGVVARVREDRASLTLVSSRR